MRFPAIFELLIGIWLMTMAAMASAQLRYLDIWEYSVEGNTLLSQDLVGRTLEPYLGVARKVDDTFEAAKALQQAYRNAGYPTVYVSVPNQDVVNGVVKLKVTEAEVRRVTISGSRYFTLSGIRSDVPALKEGKVLNVPALQSELQQANQVNRDLKVVPVITQGPTNDSIDVELSVADEFPLHGGLSVSNYNSEGTTPTRLSAELSYGNLWQKNHSFGLQAQTSPENEKEVKVLAASYTLPVGEKNSKLALYAVSSDSEIATVSDVNVIGNGSIYGLRYVNPFIQSPRSVNSISLGLDYKDFKEDLQLLDGSVQKTPISYVSWSALYNLFKRGDGVTTEFSSGISFGLRGLAGGDSEFNNKRSRAQPNFYVINGDFQQTWSLPAGWKWRYHLRGQLADSPLVSNEQFSAGGVGTVRGYYEAQIQGDYGIIGNLEVETPNFGRKWPGVDTLTLLWFYDAANLKLQDPLPQQQDNFRIDSSGFALHAQLFKQLKLDLSSGYAFKDAGQIKAGSVRTRARLSVEF